MNIPNNYQTVMPCLVVKGEKGFNPVTFFVLILFFAILSGWTSSGTWIKRDYKNYTLHYKKADKKNRSEYVKLINTGVGSVQIFFGHPFTKKFDLYILPDRESFNEEWRKDYSDPGFKSECWMVASGVANKLILISPKTWNKVACEHDYKNIAETRELITHELVHVYHGQLNTSPDFSNTEGIDWFVEGVATYASGQMRAARITEIKNAVRENKVPALLDDFWKGKMKYALSGSVIMYIDHLYGRNKLKELLKYNKKTEVMNSLNTTEEKLLTGWRDYFASYNLPG
jgi:hypothetical protein